LRARGHARGAADEPQRSPRRSGSPPAFPLAPLPHLPAVVRRRLADRTAECLIPPNGRESGHFTPNRNCAGSRPDREQGGSASVCPLVSRNILSRSSPRGAPRDSKSACTRVCDALCVAGTPLEGPRAADCGPWIPAGVHPRESGGGNERSLAATRGRGTDLYARPASLRPLSRAA
jgi:hypothetical protein